MQATIGIWQIAAALVLAVGAALYGRGWRRLHRADPGLATPLRLVAFAAALAALALALVWPLPGWSDSLLTMRSTQKVLLAMIAPVLLWLACLVHVVAWGWRGFFRRGLRWAARGDGPAAWLRPLTQPLVTWFLFLGAFLMWHDPVAVPYLMGEHWLRNVMPWALFGAGVLFWSHVVGTGPRFLPTLPSWLLIVYLIGVEIPNMIAGVTIAFSTTPLYPPYAEVHARFESVLPLGLMEDQMIGGAIVWIFGSLVYVASIVLVLHRLFRREGSTAPQPMPGWDTHERLVAPGLEHRAEQNLRRKVDLSHQ